LGFDVWLNIIAGSANGEFFNYKRLKD
jgi:hypothetical protein